jgi:predicted dehydrogenase
LSATPVRVAIIGAGNIARTHLLAYQANAATVVAFADVDLARARLLADEAGANAYADYREMLGAETVDAVSICTPPSSHRDAALHVLSRGLPVLCEKPLARSVDEGREIAEAARRAGVPFQIGLCHRFHSTVLRLKDLIDSGALGTPVSFRNRFATRIDNIQQSWFVDREIAGGGVILDNGVHSIDLFRFLCGEVTSVVARQSITIAGLKVEDTAALALTSERGIVGTIELSWATPGSDNAITVYGSEGQATVDYNAREIRFQLAGQNDWTREGESAPNRFTREISHFLECVRTGGQPSPGLGDGLRALEVIAQAYVSAKAG